MVKTENAQPKADKIGQTSAKLPHYEMLSAKTVQSELMKIGPVQFSKRSHLYHACLNYAKYLEQHQAMGAEEIEKLKAMKGW